MELFEPQPYIKIKTIRDIFGAGMVPETSPYGIGMSRQGGIIIGARLIGAILEDAKFRWANDNVLIGENTGASLTSGFKNIFIGSEAGGQTTIGEQNVFMGDQAGDSNTVGRQNVFIGAGAGGANTTGYLNTFIGYNTGYANTTGIDNVFLGSTAGYKNIDGSHNIFLGNIAGYKNTSGANNIFVGEGAGYQNTTGGGSVLIGISAGYNNAGNYNVFLGYAAGLYETGSNKLFIDNQPRTNEADARVKALMYGVFDADTANQTLRVNAALSAISFGGILEANLLDKTADEAISGAWNFDNDTLYIDTTNHRVGIGTASPTVPFHVFKETMTEYEVFFALATTTVDNPMFWVNASGDMGLGVTGYTGASFGRHDYNGTSFRHLHIGNPEASIYHQLIVHGASPGFRLQIDRASGYFGLETMGVLLKNTTSEDIAAGGAMGAFGNIAVPETLYWYLGAKATTAYNDAVFKIDKDDKIGIGLPGTDRPNAKLDVLGDTRLGDSTTNYLAISATGVLTLVGTAKRTLNLRPDLDFSKVTAQGKPTQVTYGAFSGYSLPLYVADEELFFSMNVPGRWDGASDIIVHVLVALSGAEDVNDDFRLQVSWEHADVGEPIQNTTHDVEVETNLLTGRVAAYDTYQVDFTLDWDVDDPDMLQAHDLIAMRLRRIVATGTEIAGEVIILDYHMEFTVDKMFRAPV